MLSKLVRTGVACARAPWGGALSFRALTAAPAPHDPYPVDQNDPEDRASFFEMVELFYDNAARLLQPHLIAELGGRSTVS